jgi:hypothetical protein
MQEESISSLLLFDTVLTTFIPGKERYRRKKGVDERFIAELRAFYGISLSPSS